jgi:hypothetical protein
MQLVKNRDSVAGVIGLIFAIFSWILCVLIISSIYFYPKSKESYHLQLVNRLLISDLGISSMLIIYYVIQYLIDDYYLEQFCRAYLPCLLYFFVSAYGCTIILALRFKTVNDQDPRKIWRPPIPLYTIWIGPLIFAVPVFILAFATGQVSTVHNNHADTNQTCTFNHDSILGELLDLLLFQFPLFLTILINGYFYMKGIRTLRNTPHSVIARNMNRAGGYMLVLLIVWLPNIVYNLLSIFDGNNTSFSALLDLSVFLISLQVKEIFLFFYFFKIIFNLNLLFLFIIIIIIIFFLKGSFDVAVYVWSNAQMRKWLLRNIIFLKICSKDRQQLVGSNGISPTSTLASSSSPTSSSQSKAKQLHNNTTANKREIGSDDDLNDEDDLSWLNSSPSFSSQKMSDLEHAVATATTNTTASASDTDSGSLPGLTTVNNPLNAKNIKNIDSISKPKTKSILIQQNNGNYNNYNNNHNNNNNHNTNSIAFEVSMASSIEVDQEKYVRFGE